ncbi:DUF4365 domain-containing protein [Vibrio harveyi]
MTRRTQTHITDTLAIREIMSKLPENWLVRGLEERDYGIDLSIELYDGENPTGCFSLIQVKGTSKSFSDPVSLSGFPTRTLKYAELFPEAFFIFHTSNKDKETYFVWAQKYISVRLQKDVPNWDSQDSTTIYFPKDNLLGSADGDAKIESVMKRLSAEQQGLRFLADYEWLKMHWENYKIGQFGVIDACIEITKKFDNYSFFYDFYTQGVSPFSCTRLRTALYDLQSSPIELDYCGAMSELDALRCSEVDMQISLLDAIKHTFLNQSEVDEFIEEHSDASPY